MNATRTNSSVEAARKVDVPADAILAIRQALRNGDGQGLAAAREQYGNTVYELAKFRAIANA